MNREMLREMVLHYLAENYIKTREVHAWLHERGWRIDPKRKRSGHDQFVHPNADRAIPVPRHKEIPKGTWESIQRMHVEFMSPKEKAPEAVTQRKDVGKIVRRHSK